MVPETAPAPKAKAKTNKSSARAEAKAAEAERRLAKQAKKEREAKMKMEKEADQCTACIAALFDVPPRGQAQGRRLETQGRHFTWLRSAKPTPGKALSRTRAEPGNFSKHRTLDAKRKADARFAKSLQPESAAPQINAEACLLV